jgi:hypothetical protein
MCFGLGLGCSIDISARSVLRASAATPRRGLTAEGSPYIPFPLVELSFVPGASCVSIIERVLIATRVLSDQGRWPGQSYIRSSVSTIPARPVSARPLRWPGQSSLASEPPRAAWFTALSSLTSRLGL